MKISALVVTFNEKRRLQECLQSLSFCDQIVVVDLGSTDGSVEIARSLNADIVSHNRVPIVEEVWPDIVPNLKYDWVLMADPDEFFPETLIRILEEIFPRLGDDIGYVALPRQFYFLERPLQYTIWGGLRSIRRLFNRQRVEIHGRIHEGFSLKKGYTFYEIQAQSKDAVKHYWVDSYRQLFEKHQRYIRMEGKARYERGQRGTLIRLVRSSLRALKSGFIDTHGWRGGYTNWFLCIFYAYYVFASELSLLRYQRTLGTH